MTTEEMLLEILEGQKKTDKRIEKVELQLHDMQERSQEVKQQLQTMRQQLQEVQLTLENETNREIKIIAEGHIDLSRKLDNALKVENEKEMLLLRVTLLENEVRRLKTKIEQIA